MAGTSMIARLGLPASANRHQALWRHRPVSGRGLRAGGRHHPFRQPDRGSGRGGSAGGRSGRRRCSRADLEARARAAAPAGGHRRPSLADAALRRAGRARLRGRSPRRSPRLIERMGYGAVAQAFAAVRGLSAQLGALVLAFARDERRTRPAPWRRTMRHASDGSAARGRAPSASGDAARPRTALDDIAAQLTLAHRLGVRCRRRDRTADRPARPAAAAPRAGAPAGHRLGPDPPRTQRHLGRHPRPRPTRTSSGSSRARWPSSRPSRSSSCTRRPSSSASTCSSMRPSTTCRWGSSMFDAQERLLVCNRRYAEMYELPSELTRPGTAHCALWDHREQEGRAPLSDPEADGRSAAGRRTMPTP